MNLETIIHLNNRLTYEAENLAVFEDAEVLPAKSQFRLENIDNYFVAFDNVIRGEGELQQYIEYKGLLTEQARYLLGENNKTIEACAGLQVLGVAGVVATGITGFFVPKVWVTTAASIALWGACTTERKKREKENTQYSAILNSANNIKPVLTELSIQDREFLNYQLNIYSKSRKKNIYGNRKRRRSGRQEARK